MVTFTFSGEMNSTTFFLHIFSLVYSNIRLIWIMKIRSAMQDVHTPIQEKSALEVSTLPNTAVMIALAIVTNTLAGSAMIFPQWSVHVVHFTTNIHI